MERNQRIANNAINNMSATLFNNNISKTVSNINNNNNNNVHNSTKNAINRARVNKESKSDLHYKPNHNNKPSFNCSKNTRMNTYGVSTATYTPSASSSTNNSSPVNRQINTSESNSNNSHNNNNNNSYMVNNNRLMVMSDQLSDRTPVGSASITPDFVEYDTPPHLRWAQQFSYLIEDTEGVEMFKSYLISEGVSDLLDFWFACEGLTKREDFQTEDIKKLISIIFKKYILKSSIIKLSEKVKNYLVNALKSSSAETEKRYDKNIFNDAQKEVENLLSGSIYQNFLASEIYINCLQQTQSACLGAVGGRDCYDYSAVSPIDSFGVSSRDINVNLNRNQYLDVLPTVHEDSELQTSHSLNKSHSQQKLQRHNSVVKAINKEIPTNPNLNHLFSSIKTASMNTSKNLSPRMTTESYPNTYLSNGIYINNIGNMSNINNSQSHQSYLRSKSMAFPPNPYHVKYCSYLPTSAQDSELQSLSSQSTNESMSCIADNTDNGLFNLQLSKKQLHQNMAFMKNNARANSSSNANANELCLHHKQRSTIPDYAKDLHNSPHKFADLLIKKLTELERQQQGQEKNTKAMRNILEVIASIDETNTNTINSAINTNANNNNAINSSKMVNSNCNINSNNSNNFNNNSNSNNNFNNNNNRSKQSVRDVVIRERLDFSATEESDQSILDRHFEQVFSETPNDTPEHNFGFVSPPKLRAFENSAQNTNTSLSKHMHLQSQAVSGSVTHSNNYLVDSYVPSIPVIFKYATEEYPYKLNIKDRNITLGKFKQLLPAKRGHWQYFFKRICDQTERNHLEHEFVNENISDDNQLLPLCDGKIFATIEQIAGNDCQH